jgi:signal transduction histidine kinase
MVGVDLAPEKAATTSVRVIDNGPGIPSEFRAQVFLRFFRIDGGDIALSDAPDGHGLLVAVFLPLA